MRAPFILLLVACAPYAGSADLKDPTKRPVIAQAAAAAAGHAAAALPVVSAIFYSGTRQVAIFNDQPVQVGDRVGAFRIEEITVNGVRYSAAGHSAFAPLAGHH
jgi:hypothetical protein